MEMAEKEKGISKEQRGKWCFCSNVLNCTTEILFFAKPPVFTLTKS